MDRRAIHYLDDTLYSAVCFIADPRSPFFPECIPACVSLMFPTTPEGAHTYLSANLVKNICTHTKEKIDPRLTKYFIEALVKLGYANLDKTTLVKMYNLIFQSFGDTLADLWLPQVSTNRPTAVK